VNSRLKKCKECSAEQEEAKASAQIMAELAKKEKVSFNLRHEAKAG